MNDIDLNEELQTLVASLHDEDGLQRQWARLTLVKIGRPAVPYLISTLSDSDKHARWEAAEALAVIRDPTAAAVPVQRLKDDDMDVRWAASRALIALDRAALPPLLEALVTDFSSPRLRHGAHHILHVLKDVGRLREEEIKVFELLHSVFPKIEALPWQAEAALKALGRVAD